MNIDTLIRFPVGGRVVISVSSPYQATSGDVGIIVGYESLSGLILVSVDGDSQVFLFFPYEIAPIIDEE
jgi:hypothetical protein